MRQGATRANSSNLVVKTPPPATVASIEFHGNVIAMSLQCLGNVLAMTWQCVVRQSGSKCRRRRLTFTAPLQLLGFPTFWERFGLECSCENRFCALGFEYFLPRKRTMPYMKICDLHVDLKYLDQCAVFFKNFQSSPQGS